LRRRGYRGAIIYYIVPTVWQSAFDERLQNPEQAPSSYIRKLSGRFSVLREYFDLCIAIYPLGLKLLQYFRVPYIYIGHPLCEIARPTLSREEFSKRWSLGERVIGLMPGSRVSEVVHVGREIIRSAAVIQRKCPEFSFVVPVAHPRLAGILERFAENAGADIAFISPDYRYELIHYSTLMVVTSGTAVHECAVCASPHIICYRLPPVHDFLYSVFTSFRLPYYGFTNIVGGKSIVPELMRKSCNASQIAEKVYELVRSSEALGEMKRKLQKLRERICSPEPLRTATRACLDVLSRKGILS